MSKPLSITCLQHVPFEGPGSIVTWAARHGHRLGTIRLFAGEPAPGPENFDWLIVTGGPMSVHDEARYPWLAEEKRLVEQAIGAGRKVLGICLGAQIIAQVLGARVHANPVREIGWFPVSTTQAAASTRVFEGFPSGAEVFHWHGETFDIPAGAVHVAHSEACAHQAFVYGDHVVALQFHLEMTREGAAGLIEHCANEIVASPWIQTPGAMFAGAGFDRANDLMAQVLTRMADENPDSLAGREA